MALRVVVTGATGLIGKRLVAALTKRGDEVTVFTRDIMKARVSLPQVSRFVHWNLDKPDEWSKAIDGSDAVIHLAGANIAQRWTKSYKEEILASRVRSTTLIAQAISTAKSPPRFFFCASAVGYYGDAGDKILTEESPWGTDFLANVCRNWEISARLAESATRVVTGRTGIVLDRREGALSKMLLPFKMFAGGALGSGRQWWSWVHPDDIIGSIFWCMEHTEIRGAMNICAPNPIQMLNFARELAKILHRPSWLNVPEFALKLIMGESSLIAIASQRVIPEKIIASGYRHKFSDVGEALKDVLRK